MTLNLAQGRKEDLNQLGKSACATHSNLKKIAVLLENAGADVAAQQAAGAPSFRSACWHPVAPSVPCKNGINGIATAAEGCRCAGTGARLSRYVSR